jgi:hypothetical protein
MLMMAYSNWIGGTFTFSQIAVILFKDAMNIYILVPLPLFCAITYACAGIFELNIQQLNRIYSEGGLPISLDSQLYVWKKVHQWGCETILAINNSFGLVFLLLSCFFFITFINMTFFIYQNNVNEFTSFGTWLDLSFIVCHIVQLSFMCFPIDNLRAKVGQV